MYLDLAIVFYDLLYFAMPCAMHCYTFAMICYDFAICRYVPLFTFRVATE